MPTGSKTNAILTSLTAMMLATSRQVTNSTAMARNRVDHRCGKGSTGGYTARWSYGSSFLWCGEGRGLLLCVFEQDCRRDLDVPPCFLRQFHAAPFGLGGTQDVLADEGRQVFTENGFHAPPAAVVRYAFALQAECPRFIGHGCDVIIIPACDGA